MIKVLHRTQIHIYFSVWNTTGRAARNHQRGPRHQESASVRRNRRAGRRTKCNRKQRESGERGKGAATARSRRSVKIFVQVSWWLTFIFYLTWMI